MRSQNPESLPIVTIGGFLGAGKTTLVNHLLQQSDGHRLVVFVNDFGEVNIDHSLIEAAEEDRISLKNGCVCCTLNNDLVEKIAEYVRAEIPPDGIVIEASGVADPRVFDTSFTALESAGLARLDTTLYVLDADQFRALPYELSEKIIDHAATSDFVLLNKVDLAKSSDILKLKQLLSGSAPYTNVVDTRYCAIDIELVTNIESNQVGRLQKATDFVALDVQQFSKWHYEGDSLVDREEFERFVKALPGNCLRAKGLLRFADSPADSHLFNLVGYRATIEKRPDTDDGKLSRLVVIGHSDTFEMAGVEKRFKNTLVQRQIR